MDMKLDHLPPVERVSEQSVLFSAEVARADTMPTPKIAYRFSNGREFKDLENPHAQ